MRQAPGATDTARPPAALASRRTASLVSMRPRRAGTGFDANRGSDTTMLVPV